MKNMSDSSSDEIRSDLSILYEAVRKLNGWHNDLADEYIRVGEYALALDSIAYAYLNNNIPMPPDQFKVLDRLATSMKLEKDPEYDGVIRIRACRAGTPNRPVVKVA